MTTTACRAKDPSTCPYHGERKFQEAVQSLKEAQRWKYNNVGSLEALGEANIKVNEALANLDSTEKGYKVLLADLARAEEEGSFGTITQLESRVLAATETRKHLTNAEEVDELPINDNRRISRDYLEKVLDNEEPTNTSSYDSLNLEQYIDYGNPNNNIVIPSNLTELRTALKNVRGEKNNGVRMVTINTNNLGKSDILDVHGPKDGRPLVVHVQNDFPRLHVRSGKVIIQANSRSGHSFEVYDGAEVIVLGGLRSKISTTTHTGGKTAIIPGEGGWGLQTGSGDVTIAPSAFQNSYSRHTQ